MTGLRPLYRHQVSALDSLKSSLRSGCRHPMLEAPCGFGKTVAAAHIVSGAHRKGNRVNFIVPALSLIDQTFEKFIENGIDPADMGVIQGDHEWCRPHAPIQICSVQTLARRGIPDAPVNVVDEAHIRDRQLHAYMAGEGSSKIFIGLSASPWAKGLGLVYDDLIRPISVGDLITQGFLSKFRVFSPSHPDLNGVKVDAKSGDYQTGELSERMSEATLVADVVATWLEKAAGVPTLCFAVDRPHAALLTEEFAKAGVAAAYVDAYTTRDERTEILKLLRSGTIKVICNIGTMTTGIDEDIRCIILARPTKSEMLFTQIIGRGLRPVYPDGFDPLMAADEERAAALASIKPHLTILDHSDTHLRLGMVTDLGRDALDKGKPGAGESKRAEKGLPLPKECKACGCLVPAGEKECPNCGAVMKRGSDVETLEGELVELGADGRRGKAGGKLTARDRLAAMGKRKLFAQIEQVRIKREWSSGRAAHLYHDITSVWPRGMDGVEPEEPCPELISFIRHKDLAWAKSKRRAAA